MNRKMGGCLEGFITGPRNTRLGEVSWGWRRRGVPFEGGQGPEGAVAPIMDMWKMNILILAVICGSLSDCSIVISCTEVLLITQNAAVLS
jgi:hypothetical protein